MVTTSLRSKRRIGPFGTVARVCLGTVLLIAAFAIGVESLDLLLGLVVMPLAVIVVLAARGRKAAPLRLFGATGYAVNFGLSGVLLLVMTVPALLFYGASMLLAAARGYVGCEILAIQNWITRRDDRMACPVFSPIDSLEASQRVANSRTSN